MTKEDYIEYRRKRHDRITAPKENEGDTLRNEVRAFFHKCVKKKWVVDREDLIYIVNIYSDLFDNVFDSDGAIERQYEKMVIKIKTKLKL
jgi:uncharacterized protein Yka (UPF0111/DUF47 family)